MTQGTEKEILETSGGPGATHQVDGDSTGGNTDLVVVRDRTRRMEKWSGWTDLSDERS